MLTNGKNARVEYEKILAMLRDPAHPKRQRAQLRIAQAKFHPKGPQRFCLR